jgi:hypothetical protein
MHIARVIGAAVLAVLAHATMAACTGGAGVTGDPGASDSPDASSGKDPDSRRDESSTSAQPGREQPGAGDAGDETSCENFVPDPSSATTLGSCTFDNGSGYGFCQEWGWADSVTRDGYDTATFKKTCESSPSNRWSDDPCDRSNVAFGCRLVGAPYPWEAGCVAQVETVWYSADSKAAPKECPSDFERLDP